MSRVPTNVSFEDWVRRVFDHPVTREAWYWEIDSDSFELDPKQLVAYSTQLFKESADVLAPFTDEQHARRVQLLFGVSASIEGSRCFEGARRIRSRAARYLRFSN